MVSSADTATHGSGGGSGVVDIRAFTPTRKMGVPNRAWRAAGFSGGETHATTTAHATAETAAHHFRRGRVVVVARISTTCQRKWRGVWKDGTDGQKQ